MDAKTRKALEGSIKKWEGIVAGEVADQGEDNCPLCQMFSKGRLKDRCTGCPVNDYTGNGCGGSPYENFEEMSDFSGLADTQDLKDAAQAELDFLISLRPEETQ